MEKTKSIITNAKTGEVITTVDDAGFTRLFTMLQQVLDIAEHSDTIELKFAFDAAAKREIQDVVVLHRLIRGQ